MSNLSLFEVFILFCKKDKIRERKKQTISYCDLNISIWNKANLLLHSSLCLLK